MATGLRVLAGAAGGLLLLLALRLLMAGLAYRVTELHFEITLFGVCVRRVPLTDIRYLSKHRSGLAEYWWNTAWPAKRILVIRRRRGWLKNLVITPENRYAFKAEVERAMARLPQGEAGAAEADPAVRD